MAKYPCFSKKTNSLSNCVRKNLPKIEELINLSTDLKIEMGYAITKNCELVGPFTGNETSIHFPDILNEDPEIIGFIHTHILSAAVPSLWDADLFINRECFCLGGQPVEKPPDAKEWEMVKEVNCFCVDPEEPLHKALAETHAKIDHLLEELEEYPEHKAEIEPKLRELQVHLKTQREELLKRAKKEELMRKIIKKAKDVSEILAEVEERREKGWRRFIQAT